MKPVGLRDANCHHQAAGGRALLTEAETLDQALVALAISPREVGEQAVAATNHEEKTTATVMIFGVGLEVTLQRADAFTEDGHLNFRRTGVGGVRAVATDDSGFLSCGDRHCF